MEESKRKIRVLWIDDEPSDSFLDEAYDNGLVVEVRKTVKAGLKELQNKNEIYEAIILDANCKIEDEDTETPQLIALANAIVGIKVDTEVINSMMMAVASGTAVVLEGKNE